MRDLLIACRYLTALPLPRSAGPGDLGRAAGWFPVVGLLLGVILAALALLVERGAPPLVGAVLIVALWALLTGGLHLDGLADALDGLGGGWSREEALAIMRDARTGAYGVTAIVLVLAAKLATIAGLSPGLRWRALIVAPVLARLGPLVLSRLCPPARGEGAGHVFALSVRAPGLAVGLLTAAAVALGLLGPAGALLFVLAVAGAALFAWYLRRRLGGLTGDCLGALVEALEAVSLVALSVLAHLGRF
ncbi:MAG: adenosylcobinamide-GDP ribazoletransferase [Candidatus Rokubacteria bacterium]|nr:adenosylcobinamide-GDP ribazoletransferase [Candidatus Rokubacteria bacterium]